MSLIKRLAASLARARTGALVLSLGGLLAACAGTGPMPLAQVQPRAYAPPAGASYATTTPPAPRSAAAAAGRYKLGPPYQQFGVWYVPAEQPDYNQVGLASWYGDAFDGKKTADGETFDMRAISAAHATLPMPCLVEVTNLDNGRSLIVRLNDRGPYHPGRIIDLSRAGAQALGYEVKGTAHVRVRYVGPAPLDASLSPMQNPLTYAERPIGPPTQLPPIPASPFAAAAPRPASTASGSAFVVQAGAFASRAAAEHAVSRVASAGTATIKPVSRNGQTLYKVVVGPWDDREAASDARGRIAAMGFSDAWLSVGS